MPPSNASTPSASTWATVRTRVGSPYAFGSVPATKSVGRMSFYGQGFEPGAPAKPSLSEPR